MYIYNIYKIALPYRAVYQLRTSNTWGGVGSENGEQSQLNLVRSEWIMYLKTHMNVAW